MNINATKHRRMRGLTLIETMVAITISLILMAGAITLFINNQATYTVNDNLSRLQENARFAVDFMIDDLRLAGYFGCAGEPVVDNNVVGITAGDGDLEDTDSVIEGFDDANLPLEWSPSGNDDNIANIIADTDAITVRHLSGTSQIVSAGTSSFFTLADASAFEPGDQVAISQCGRADVFEINTIGGNTITPVGGPLKPEAPYSGNGNPTDTRNPIVAPFIAVRYYVGNGTSGPSLFREVVRDGAITQDELIEGVESMHIVYGVDTTFDRVADTYVPAGDALLDTPDEWRSVMSVKIAMLLRTLEEYGPADILDNNQYQLNDFQFDAPGDRFKRRVFNITVLLRNRLL